MQAPRLILKPAQRDDAGRLLAFYQASPDRFLIPRPAGEFESSIALGQFFVVTNETKEIVAASGIFDYDEEAFAELAETLVAREARGYGLQSVFFKLRIASAIAFQGPSVGITTAIDARNKVSLETAVALGFEPWAQPVASAYSSCPSCPNRKARRVCCCDYYLLSADKARAAVRSLLDDTRWGSVKLKNGRGEALALKCECPVLKGDLRKALRRYVAGETW